MYKHQSTFLALLRGINVGGNHIIPMADLKSVFEEMCFTDVSTYIQSGNVLFSDTDTHNDTLTNKIEVALSKKYSFTIPVVTLSYKQLKDVVNNAPTKFGTDPTTYRYDVLFLKPPLVSTEAIINVSIKVGVDQVSEGKGVLYFSRLIEKASQSHLSRIVKLPIYQHMTIRNWNTTTKLLRLMEV